MKRFYVYILCSKRNGTLYTGVTSGLVKRVYEHKHGLVEGFTKKYNLLCTGNSGFLLPAYYLQGQVSQE